MIESTAPLDAIKGGSMIPKKETLRDFLSTAHEKPECVVDDLLPKGGLSIMAAPPKVGKSNLVRNLILSVARGFEFLGRKTEQGTVLYLPLEEPRQHIGYELHLLGARNEPIIIRQGAINKQEILTVIENDIQQDAPSLVVIDPLFDALELDDSNGYAKANTAMKELLYIARKSGAHILTVHHAGKGGGQGIASILGSQAFAGATDTNIILTASSSGERWLSTIQRVGIAIERTRLYFDPASHRISLGENVRTVKADIKQRQILDVLKEVDELDRESIVKRVGGRKQDVLAAIRDLEDNQQIVERTSLPDGRKRLRLYEGGALNRRG